MYAQAHKKVTTTFHFESGLIRLAMQASFPSMLEPFIANSFLPLSSLSPGTLRYMISYMISEDNDIEYDIIGFEMSMIS